MVRLPRNTQFLWLSYAFQGVKQHIEPPEILGDKPMPVLNRAKVREVDAVAMKEYCLPGIVLMENAFDLVLLHSALPPIKRWDGHCS